MIAQCMLLFNYTSYMLKKRFHNILIQPFKDLTEFPSNLYFISKQKQKSSKNVSTKNKSKKKGYNKEDKSGSKEEEKSLEGKKIIHFECFTCGFKVNIDKSSAEN